RCWPRWRTRCLAISAASRMRSRGSGSAGACARPRHAQDETGSWGTDTLLFGNDELSYALGKQGATRKKLERSTGCVVQYVGNTSGPADLLRHLGGAGTGAAVHPMAVRTARGARVRPPLAGSRRLHRRGYTHGLRRLHHREPARHPGRDRGRVGLADVLRQQGRGRGQRQGEDRAAGDLRVEAGPPGLGAEGDERRGDEDARLLHARPDHQEVLPTGLRHRPNTLQGRRAELRPGQGGGHQEEVGDGGWRRPAVRRARGVHRGDPRGAAALQGLHRLAAPAAQGCHHGPGREGPRGRHGAEDPRQLQGLGRRGPRARAPADGEGDRHVHVHGDRRAWRGAPPH
ncbi:unnamed protein product, partial [Prorocentrum cordatum]